MKLKLLTLAAALVLTVPAFSDTQQDTAPTNEKPKEEEIHVEENPELCFEDFSMETMDEKDKETSGYNKLTPTERDAIAHWFKNRDQSELDVAVAKQDEPVQPATPSPKEEPVQSESTAPKQEPALSGTIAPTQELAQSETAAPTQEAAPSETTAPMQELVQSETKTEEQKPTQVLTTVIPINPSEANNALQAAIEDGKTLVLESKTKYLVPTLLRKKTANWKSGDILKVEMTKRPNWAKITNLISNETILAKIEPEDIKK